MYGVRIPTVEARRAPPQLNVQVDAVALRVDSHVRRKRKRKTLYYWNASSGSRQALVDAEAQTQPGQAVVGVAQEFATRIFHGLVQNDGPIFGIERETKGRRRLGRGRVGRGEPPLGVTLSTKPPSRKTISQNDPDASYWPKYVLS
jgi:hypothetical protein